MNEFIDSYKLIEKIYIRWHSPYIFVYKDPLLSYLFGICVIYFDLKVLELSSAQK